MIKKKKKNYVVKKSNILNELQLNEMTLFEYKLFCILLSRLDSNSVDGSVVLSLEDYAEIMNIKRARQDLIKKQTSEIVKKACYMDFPDGRGFATYTLVHACLVYPRKSDGKWVIEMKINPELLPLVQKSKERFISYKLYNTIYLNSYQTIRIYELLKQYEGIGERVIGLKELRAFLSIADSQYSEWYEFSRWVLSPAQKAISEKTDITFQIQTIRKSHKVDAVKFVIEKNKNFVDPFEDKLLGESSCPADNISNDKSDNAIAQNADIDFFRSALANGDNLSDEQIEYIVSSAWNSDFAEEIEIPKHEFEFKQEIHKYISMQEKYTILKKPENYFSYLVAAIKDNYAKC